MTSPVLLIIDDFSQRHNLPTPQLHVDAAVGWAMTFLADYDLQRNLLQLDNEVHETVRRIQQHCVNLRVADSVTLYFHKMVWSLSQQRLYRQSSRRLEVFGSKCSRYALFLRCRYPARSSSTDARMFPASHRSVLCHGIAERHWHARLANADRPQLGIGGSIKEQA